MTRQSCLPCSDHRSHRRALADTVSNSSGLVHRARAGSMRPWGRRGLGGGASGQHRPCSGDDSAASLNSTLCGCTGGEAEGRCDKQPQAHHPNTRAWIRRHFPRAHPRRLLCHDPPKDSPAPGLRPLNYIVVMPVSLISIKCSF